jgi:hypothetical protein
VVRLPDPARAPAAAITTAAPAAAVAGVLAVPVPPASPVSLLALSLQSGSTGGQCEPQQRSCGNPSFRLGSVAVEASIKLDKVITGAAAAEDETTVACTPLPGQRWHHVELQLVELRCAHPGACVVCSLTAGPASTVHRFPLHVALAHDAGWASSRCGHRRTLCKLTQRRRGNPLVSHTFACRNELAAAAAPPQEAPEALLSCWRALALSAVPQHMWVASREV